MKSLITEALDEYFKADDLSRRCADCNKAIEIKPERRITLPPKALILCLKRFEHNKHTNSIKKINNPIKGENLLNLRKYCIEGKDVVYKLKAVIHHLGHVDVQGHYITVAEDSHEISHKFDDSWVITENLIPV